MSEKIRDEKEKSLELMKWDIDGRDSFRPEVSPAVIKRLPRYFQI